MARSLQSPVLSHWSKLVEGFQHSSLDFYSQVEQAIARRQLPNVKTSRVNYLERGTGSAEREYLRVRRGRYLFDLCAAPFGTGFFVSSWLVAPSRSPIPLILLTLGEGAFLFGLLKIFGVLSGLLAAVVFVPVLFTVAWAILNEAMEGWDDLLVAIPLFGSIYERIFRPQTYYQVDSAEMFHASVQASLLEVLDAVTTARGVRVLSGPGYVETLDQVTAD